MSLKDESPTEVAKPKVFDRPIRWPFVNEEHGYEGESDRPGHGMNADGIRRSHWTLAMAGGYEG